MKTPNATLTMTEDTLHSLDLPTVRRKKVTSNFEGALISSDGGLVLLSKAVRDKPSARKVQARAVAVRLLPAIGSMPLTASPGPACLAGSMNAVG